MLAGESLSSVSHCVGKTIESGAGRLQLVEVLGEGAYGVVYLAVEQQGDATSSKASSPRQFAVKVLHKAADWTVEGQCQSREIVTHKIASSHPNVLTVHDVIEDDKDIYLVLDYCPGGDLYSAIVDRNVYARNDALIKSVFVQILDAVQACHDQGIYHRDLKPDNIFVSADGSEVYLGDFGLATDQELSHSFGCGSRFYMSPECIGEERNWTPFYTEISDIWSLGVIFTNLVCRRNPWHRATTEDPHFYQYMSNRDGLGEMLPISKAGADILKRVFTFNPAERISIAELRAAVLRADTFFPAEGEVAAASPKVECAAAVDTPPIPAAVFNTPDFYDGSDSMHFYPDDEYLYASPNPDDSPLPTPSSATALSSPSSLFSDSCTLYSEKGDGAADDAKGKAFGLAFVQEEDVAEAKLGAPQVGHRLLAKLLA